MVKYKNTLFSLIIVLLFSIIIPMSFLNLFNADFSIPFAYSGGDETHLFVDSKNILENGWLYQNPRIAAPFGGENYGFTEHLLHNFDALLLKIFLLITNNYVVAANLLYLSVFPLTAISSYFVLREMKVGYLFSTLGALTFSNISYIYMRYTHFKLACVYFVPISILLCCWLLESEFFIFGKGFFKSKKNIAALIFLLLIANNGSGYYTFFSCFFFCVSMLYKIINKKSIKAGLNNIYIIFTIVVFFLLNFLPVFFGSPEARGLINDTGFAGAEIYGLKITQLLMPVNSHNIGFIENIINSYNEKMPLVNENKTAYLGLAGIAGFIILLLGLSKRKNNNYKNIYAYFSVLVISAVLFATIGGFSNLVAFVLPRIRGYNRISAFIAFFSITILCISGEKIIKRIKTKKVQISCSVLSVLFFSVSVFEQIPAATFYNNTDKYLSDKAFVEKIESQSESGSMIFQLPAVSYPLPLEDNKTIVYEHFAGFLHSKTLKWSYGGIIESQSDIWVKQTAALPINEMIEKLKDNGFSGIYIDRNFYNTDELSALENLISQILNEKPIYSELNDLSFFKF